MLRSLGQRLGIVKRDNTHSISDARMDLLYLTNYRASMDAAALVRMPVDWSSGTSSTHYTDSGTATDGSGIVIHREVASGRMGPGPALWVAAQNGAPVICHIEVSAIEDIVWDYTIYKVISRISGIVGAEKVGRTVPVIVIVQAELSDPSQVEQHLTTNEGVELTVNFSDTASVLNGLSKHIQDFVADSDSKIALSLVTCSTNSAVSATTPTEALAAALNIAATATRNRTQRTGLAQLAKSTAVAGGASSAALGKGRMLQARELMAALVVPPTSAAEAPEKHATAA